MASINKFARRAAVMACTASLGLTALTGCMGKTVMTPQEKQDAMAKAPGDIIATATGANMEDVSTVVTAIKQAGLVETLQGPGPFTVFAPTNEAFKELDVEQPGEVEMLMKPENQAKLKDVLLYHVHVGDGYLTGEMKTMNLSTAEGKPLMVKVDGNTIMLNNTAKIVKPDIICRNGVIHWVDKVLVPPTAGGM